MIKVGLIYVAEGQDEQLEIFKNTQNKVSGGYKEFSASLGWPVRQKHQFSYFKSFIIQPFTVFLQVDLKTHKGYTGGLHDDKDGQFSLYWVSPMIELMYHEVVRMPTVQNDETQLNKVK